MAQEYSPTKVICGDSECDFVKTYSSWAVACMAAARHRAATGHDGDVMAMRTKAFSGAGSLGQLTS